MRGGAGLTALDLDYREVFWNSPDEARGEIAEGRPQVDVVVGNMEECAVAVGESDPIAAGEASHSIPPEPVKA